MNSPNRFGRRERSTVFSPPSAAGSTMRPPGISASLRSVVTRYRPPDRRRNDSRIRRSVGEIGAFLPPDGRDGELGLRPREPEGGERLRGLRFRRRRDVRRLSPQRGEIDRNLLQPVRQLQGDPLGELLPDPRHAREGGGVFPRARREDARNGEDRQHRHGGLRSHAAHADRRQEDLALRVRGETVQVGAALPEMEMRAEDAALAVGGEVLAGRVGDARAESDPGALQHHEILPAPGQAPSQMVDHRGL